MRKIISILLALTFLLYLGGVQVMYWVKMSVCKQESHRLIQNHKISENGAVSFSFTPTEYNSLSWSEQNKEFTYQGQRYDIIEMKYFSDEIIINCYSDKEETNLMDAFSGFIKKMFASPQQSNDSNNDITSKICKEYLATKALVPSFFPSALISIKANCVLVDVSAGIDAIWRPPTLA